TTKTEQAHRYSSHLNPYSCQISLHCSAAMQRGRHGTPVARWANFRPEIAPACTECTICATGRDPRFCSIARCWQHLTHPIGETPRYRTPDERSFTARCDARREVVQKGPEYGRKCGVPGLALTMLCSRTVGCGVRGHFVNIDR